MAKARHGFRKEISAAVEHNRLPRAYPVSCDGAAGRCDILWSMWS
ncbi:hypothetical protein STXM2123_323 [Streptomyces sp. F-3]|nr:hypothetical protein STXM2123_323 [Streptomyces sp. F-3]